ncbi:unnamed protein product [Rhizophagus irregularis]|nr:unnamed protein product [Rhizophagus irregularis]
MEEDSYQGHKFIPKELKDCPECGKPRISFGWCRDCETNSMKENFLYWTSENKEIDELIRHTQLNASQTCDYLEWIPFEKFEMVKYIGSGGFGSVYSALWMEGPRWNWDDGAQEWARAGPMTVALKRLDNSQKISSSFINQIKTYHKCLQSASLAETFGITKDPTSNYMIVMKYYENGNLYQYLDRSNGILSWRDMIDMLWGIAGGLERIHAEGEWITLICDDPSPSQISDESSVAEEKRWKMISQTSKKYSPPEKNPHAYYTSRPLWFHGLSSNMTRCHSNYSVH